MAADRRPEAAIAAGSLLDGLPAGPLDTELFEALLDRPGVRLERIVSTGQTTPDGDWDDQTADEWVVLLRG